MKKQIQLFLSLNDEIRWSSILKTSIPTIRFINDNVWPRSLDERNGFENCPSGRVYLFDGDLKALPTRLRKSGELEGPISGCVVQVLRPSLRDGVLLSGRLAAGFENGDERMKSFVTKVWRILMGLGAIGVVRPNGQTDKKYLVGLQLIAELKKGEAKIADRATKIPYQLPENV